MSNILVQGNTDIQGWIYGVDHEMPQQINYTLFTLVLDLIIFVINNSWKKYNLPFMDEKVNGIWHVI
jgi:hypothetical protein